MMVTRPLDVHVPPAAPPALVLTAICEKLRNHGCKILRVDAEAIEFRGPAWFYLGFSREGESASLVEHGVLHVDWVAAHGRMRLEMRLRREALLMLVVQGCVAAAIPVPPMIRLFILLAIAAIFRERIAAARLAYQRWIADAVQWAV